VFSIDSVAAGREHLKREKGASQERRVFPHSSEGRSDLVQKLQPRTNRPWVPPKALCNVGQRSFPSGGKPAGQKLKHLDQIMTEIVLVFLH
jgi:hypothetical protein